ncbi:MAG: hypothetical protein E6K53_06610, partial [Gammaproteobacteria bacterium]
MCMLFISVNNKRGICQRAWTQFAWLAVVFLALAATLPAFARDSANQIELGRTLFNDPSLSVDHKTSCASCHDPAHAFADPRPRSVGVAGNVGTRNAPSLIGVAADHTFFWDGRRTQLEEVVLDPFTNPVELGRPSLQAAL